MSSGKVHKKYNNAITVVGTGGALFFGGFELALPVFIGCIAGTITSPDMDLNAALPASFMTKIPGVRLVWGTIWRPYQLAVKHRSFWSHFPFVGTTGRILYLGLWTWFCTWILWQMGFDISPESVYSWLVQNTDFWIVIYLMWACQDVAHWLLDL